MTKPPITSQITWVYTENTEASFRFWGEDLGLELERDAGTARIYRTAEGARVGVCEAFDARVVQPEGSMITLITEDVDGWYEALLARGVPTRGAPEVLERFGIYSFFCLDPSGYVVEIQTFLD